MKKLQLISAICLITTCYAIEDTKENRITESKRYLEATPPAEMFEDMAINIAKTMPEEQRDKFIRLLTENLDITALTTAIQASMVKTFTADELKALADFYSSPEGKSSMKKMGMYMADLMPVMQSEIQKAMKAARESESIPEEPELAPLE